jgi:hypothetical protein
MGSSPEQPGRQAVNTAIAWSVDAVLVVAVGFLFGLGLAGAWVVTKVVVLVARKVAGR